MSSIIITDSFEETDEVQEEEEEEEKRGNNDVLTQLPKSRKEVRTRACSERSDSGISDCSAHTHVTSSSCNSTPLLGKKFSINEETEPCVSFVSSATLHLNSGAEKTVSGRLGSKIESFSATLATPSKSESLSFVFCRVSLLANYLQL